MKQIIVYILLLLGFVSNLQAQMAMDTIRLPEVKLMESKLIAHTIGTQMDIIKSATLSEGISSDLASIISSSSSVYIKQYGALATPTFRGTSSSHTLVLWNGVPLNSIANGLSDFSSINTLNFTDILLVHGGNASVFGSGAVGGSVHLNSDLKYTEEMTKKFMLLPLHSMLSNEDVVYICKKINEFYSSKIINK